LIAFPVELQHHLIIARCFRCQQTRFVLELMLKGSK